MPTMTLAISEDLQVLIKKHNEIKWSEIARRAMWEYAMKIELLDSILEKSEFTEEDAMEMGKKINKALKKQYEKEGS